MIVILLGVVVKKSASLIFRKKNVCSKVNPFPLARFPNLLRIPLQAPPPPPPPPEKKVLWKERNIHNFNLVSIEKRAFNISRKRSYYPGSEKLLHPIWCKVVRKATAIE